MEPESGRRTGEATQAAQEAAERAGAAAQARVTQLSDRARDAARGAARGADERVAHLTGRSLEEWTTAVRDFVRDRPLQAVAITVGLGYLLGKLTRRR